VGAQEKNTIRKECVVSTRAARFTLFAAIAFAAFAVVVLLTASSGGASARQQVTGNEDHAITLDQAVKYIENFKSNPTAPSMKGAFFGRGILDKILAQPGCLGIRYYYAKKDDGSATVVLAGVDTDGNDIEQGVLAEMPIPCPPFCPSSGQLSK
jgi:hypothetical protein